MRVQTKRKKLLLKPGAHKNLSTEQCEITGGCFQQNLRATDHERDSSVVHIHQNESRSGVNRDNGESICTQWKIKSVLPSH